GVTVAAWTTGGSAPTPAEAEQLTRAELELGSSSPFVVGLSARRPLVLDDFDGDARFGGWSGPWAKVLRGLGCRSLALVPLRLGHEVIGAVAAAYPHPRAISVDHLAGKLLDFARLDAADVRMNRRQNEVSVEVTDVLDNVAPVLAEHPVEMDIPAGVAVAADPNAFADVLTNLLTNAAKFSPDGAP